MQISPQQFLSAGGDGNIIRWHLHEGQQRSSHPNRQGRGVTVLATSASGAIFSGGFSDASAGAGMIMQWSSELNLLMKWDDGYPIHHLAVLESGAVFVAAGGGSFVLGVPRVDGSINVPASSSPACSVVIYSRQQAICGYLEGRVVVFDMTRAVLRRPFQHQEVVFGIGVLPRDEFLTGGDGPQIQRWDLNGRPLSSPIKQDDFVSSIAPLSANRHLCGGVNSGVTLWDAKGQSVGRKYAEQSSVWSLAVCSRKTFLIGSREDGLLCCQVSGSCRRIDCELPTHEAEITGVAALSDSEFLTGGPHLEENIRGKVFHRRIDGSLASPPLHFPSYFTGLAVLSSRAFLIALLGGRVWLCRLGQAKPMLELRMADSYSRVATLGWNPETETFTAGKRVVVGHGTTCSVYDVETGPLGDDAAAAGPGADANRPSWLQRLWKAIF